MDASAVIHYRLDLLIQLCDTTTGLVVEERNVRFYREGRAIYPVSRGSGNYVFINTGRTDMELEIDVYGYEKTIVFVQYEALDSQMPIQEVFLIPLENTSKGPPVITFSGWLPGVEAIQAVNLGYTCCCISEFDERKRIMKLFKTHNIAMDDKFYGLIHLGQQTYEPITIVKEISQSSVKLSQPLQESFSINSPIVRVIFGKTSPQGDYCIRIRDDAERLMYLIRYVVSGSVKFKTVDFRHLDGIVLE